MLTLKKESTMKQYTKAKALFESLKTIPDYRVDIGKVEYPLTNTDNNALERVFRQYFQTM